MSEDIIVPIDPSKVATHRKPRSYDVRIVNGLVDKYVVFNWQSIPGRLVDGEFVPVEGEPQEEPSLRRQIGFNPDNPDHVTIMELLSKMAKESIL